MNSITKYLNQRVTKCYEDGFILFLKASLDMYTKGKKC